MDAGLPPANTRLRWALRLRQTVSTYVALLRAVNVGGNKLRMEDARGIFSSAGAMNVRTYRQSGNVVFCFDGGGVDRLLGVIADRLLESVGLKTAILSRTADELRKVIACLPFSGAGESKLHVTFLSSRPHRFSTEEIEGACTGDEKYLLAGREIYLYCPYGYGRTKLTNNFFEKELGVQATTRNWRTVRALSSISDD